MIDIVLNVIGVKTANVNVKWRNNMIKQEIATKLAGSILTYMLLLSEDNNIQTVKNVVLHDNGTIMILMQRDDLVAKLTITPDQLEVL